MCLSPVAVDILMLLTSAQWQCLLLALVCSRIVTAWFDNIHTVCSVKFHSQVENSTSLHNSSFSGLWILKILASLEVEKFSDRQSLRLGGGLTLFWQRFLIKAAFKIVQHILKSFWRWHEKKSAFMGLIFCYGMFCLFWNHFSIYICAFSWAKHWTPSSTSIFAVTCAACI